MRVNAYAAPAAGQPLAPTTIERRDVGPNDVLIDIQYAGICHSDIHTVNGDWGPQPFPVVPGHEIVGTVTATGADVTRHQVGDRVGVGCLVNSCGHCTHCRNGDEQYCENGMVPTYAGLDRDGTTTQGGYSTHVVVDADYVLSVPQNLDPAAAAPLLCAGITTYAPAAPLECRPRHQGRHRRPRRPRHMAVKIAHALGADVTVLSQTLKKQEDGLRLGADAYHATSDPATFEQLAGRFDLIVNTVSAGIDLNAYLGLLAIDGTLVNVGAPRRPAQCERDVPDQRSPQLRRIDDRRHRPHPGNARLLRHPQHRIRHRNHPRRQNQPSLRTGPRLRHPLPLRHRHHHPQLTPA